MRPRAPLIAAALALSGAAAAVSSPPSWEGPPAGFSGGFGEPSCVECHIGNDVNAFDGRVSLEGVPQAYESGRTYVLTVILEAEGTEVAGFQLTARHAAGSGKGRDAGRLEPTDPGVAVRDSAGVSYAHQTAAGSAPLSNDRTSWTVAWEAPAGDGPVTINVAANSGNGDNSPLSDLVYLAAETVGSAAQSSGPGAGGSSIVARFPLDATTLASVRSLAAVAEQVDSVSLLHDLSVLSADSMEGRAPGTPGSRRAREFLVGALERAGAAPLGSDFRHPFTWDGGSGENLVGAVPGSGGGGTIVLTAHFDHEGVQDGTVFNGADDNASGVAAALEVVRRVRETSLRHDLVVALLDAEESGLRGARAFVGEPTVSHDEIVLNVNLDMVSRTGGLLWAAGAHHTPALAPVLERVAAAAPLTLRLGHDRPGAPEGDDWTRASDHGPFHDAGLPFVYFGVEDHPDYHRPTDDFERVDPGEYVAAVRTILAALRALDDAAPFRAGAGTP